MEARHLKYLRVLDLKAGASREELKTSYKELCFVWHPDRQPERLKEKAEEKIKKINDAYQYFMDHPEQLEIGFEEDDIVQLGHQHDLQNGEYRVEQETCMRCHGTGKTAHKIGKKCEFIEKDCPICDGVGIVLVDRRNTCQSCLGSGMTPNITSQDRSDYIEERIDRGSWLGKLNYRITYKKLWLEFHQKVLICHSCEGSGYFYRKKDHRSQERRKRSEADFIFTLHHDDQRKSERRTATV